MSAKARKRVEAGQSTSQPIIRDKLAFARAVGWMVHPYLMRFYRKDVEQEFAILMHEHPEVVAKNRWSSLVQRALHRLAKDLGIKRGRGDAGYLKKEVPFAILYEGDEEDDWIDRIEVLIETQEWDQLGEHEWTVDAYQFSRQVLSGGDIRFKGRKERRDWALFNAWLQGWSEEEIRLSFGIKGNLRVQLAELAYRIRKAAEIEVDDPLPMPRKLGVNLKIMVKKGQVKIPRVRKGIPGEIRKEKGKRKKKK